MAVIANTPPPSFAGDEADKREEERERATQDQREDARNGIQDERESARNGRQDEREDGRNGRQDEREDGRVDGRQDGREDGRNGRQDEREDGRVEGRQDGREDGRNGRQDEREDGRNGRLDEREDRRVGRRDGRKNRRDGRQDEREDASNGRQDEREDGRNGRRDEREDRKDGKQSERDGPQSERENGRVDGKQDEREDRKDGRQSEREGARQDERDDARNGRQDERDDARNGRQDERKDGRVDERQDEREDARDGRQDEREDARDGRQDEREDGRVDGRLDERDNRKDGRQDEREAARQDEREDGKVDGRQDEREDGRQDEREDGREGPREEKRVDLRENKREDEKEHAREGEREDEKQDKREDEREIAREEDERMGEKEDGIEHERENGGVHERAEVGEADTLDGVRETIAASTPVRGLSLGERVEVRQKEIGLRGSWHAGVVVKAKNGRRLVEYDELMNLDGIRKLRELIPVPRGLEEVRAVPRQRESTSYGYETSYGYGFIRPIPPAVDLSSFSWSKGLLVDAFYQDAWWEGVIIEDAMLANNSAIIKVLFPDEGDQMLASLSSLRVTQDWNAATGEWAIRGRWLSIGLNVPNVWSLMKDWKQGRKSGNLQTETFSCRERETRDCNGGARERDSGFRRSIRLHLSSKLVGMEPEETEERNESISATVSSSSLAQSVENLFDESTHIGPARKVTCSRLSSRLAKDMAKALKSSKRASARKRNRICRSFLNHDTEFFYNSDILKQAQTEAKNILLDAGWKIVRRHRNNRSDEAVYISHSGRRFRTLVAACLAWGKDNGIAAAIDVRSEELRRLQAYGIAKRLNCVKDAMHRKKKNRMVDNSAISNQSSILIPSHEPLTDARKNSNSGTDSKSKRVSCKVHKKRKSWTSYEELDSAQKPKRTKHTFTDENSGSGKIGKIGELFGQQPGTKNGNELKKSKSLSKRSKLSTGNKPDTGKRGCRMQVILSPPIRKATDHSPSAGVVEPSYMRKRTIMSWLIDIGFLQENSSVRYLNRKDGHVMKEGLVTRDGVQCVCCNQVFNLSSFEAHAGSKLHRPCANLFLGDGRSLSQLQVEALAHQNEHKQPQRCTSNKANKDNKDYEVESSDDTCCVCGDGGELLLCDGCPSTFHADCLGLEGIPEGDWFCSSCCCGLCGNNFSLGDNAVSSQEEMLFCKQCERRYHPCCVKENWLCNIDPEKGEFQFCSCACQKIFGNLRKLVGTVNCLQNGLSWTLLRSMAEDEGSSSKNLEVVAEHNSKLSVASGVMQECFVPMIDHRTKINIISQILYNRRSRVDRLNYSGFYTMILERGDEIISVASIRIHGGKFAEMPLIGTRFQYRRQGMCRSLMASLEEMLSSVGVRKLILPAVPELLETWIGSFKFQHLGPSEKRELMEFGVISFPGTSLLRKALQDFGLQQGKSYMGCNNSCSSNQPREKLADLFIDSGPSETSTKTAQKTGEDVSRHHLKAHKLHAFKQVINMGFCETQNNRSKDYSCHQFSTSDIDRSYLTPGENHINSAKKNKTPTERELNAVSLGSTANLDDVLYNSKVILTTTRSNRLVKSSWWVADALKRLTKDPKHLWLTKKRRVGPRSRRLVIKDKRECKSSTDYVSRAIDGNRGSNLLNVYTRTRRRPFPFACSEKFSSQKVLDFSTGSRKSTEAFWNITKFYTRRHKK